MTFAEVLSAFFNETTIVDHLLWGALIGLLIRLVQWLRAPKVPPAPPPRPRSFVQVAGLEVAD